MYIINFLKCMDLKLLAKNRKADNMAFATILIMVIAFALLIWYFFYTKSLAEKGETGVNAIKNVLKGGGI